jgi:hypothetical protein
MQSGRPSQSLPVSKQTSESSVVRRDQVSSPDAFESAQGDVDEAEVPRSSVDLDDIPIELISLIDSFIDSLSAKVHQTPLTIDNVSRLFQDFYALAATHANTHVASLATKQQREGSPAPSTSSRTSAASLLRAKAGSLGKKEQPKPGVVRSDSAEQQMLTAEELADRKRARKALEQKRAWLEEGVERRLCEGTYERIYRHRTSQDEAEDSKLRSKTAALAVVGIGPADLGIELGSGSAEDDQGRTSRVEEVRQSLEPARKSICMMQEKRYPYGKLSHLKAAHKSIVETLARFHPSASADELLPMMIYTLISMPPEHLSVISDMRFIQRFRWEEKLTGEAAYCLTNLEAAVGFLETVDLSTLRADETTGPTKAAGSAPGTPKVETFPPLFTSGIAGPLPESPTTDTSPKNNVALRPNASPLGLRSVSAKSRRLSDLVNTPAQAFNAASDAVFSTADHGIKTIGNSLGDSYKFLIGKLRERDDAAGPSGEIIVPKTLDDARKLIGTPPPDEDGTASAASSVHGPDSEQQSESHLLVPPKDEKMLSLIGGRKMSRDHSADSSRSGGSSKRVLFADEASSKDKVGGTGGAGTVANSSLLPPTIATPPIMESMRNFGNSLNPINKLTSFGGFKGFGRTTPLPTATLPPPPPTLPPKGVAEGGDLATVSLACPSRPFICLF